MNHWLSASLDALAHNRPALLISLLAHPNLLPVPVGPVAVFGEHGLAGALHLGSARAAVLDACEQTLSQPAGTVEHRSYTLNPWAGHPSGHVVELQLRVLDQADRPALDGLRLALERGDTAVLHLDRPVLAVEVTGDTDPLPLSVQASGVQAGRAHFATPARTALVVGAGVLAHRVVECLADTPLRVGWLTLGSPVSLTSWPANAVQLDAADFVLGETPVPDHCHALIMTHDHDLDIDLCHRLLQQSQLQSLGMVGSANKRRLLEQALAERGVSAAAVDRVRCPLGGDNHGNLEHASVAIAAELLALR